MRIAISSDHAGYALKSALMKAFQPEKEFVDLGAYSTDTPSDYPKQAHLLAEAMLTSTDIDFGVLICGSGIGISIAGNRHKHLRVALCSEPELARLARAHNDANVLALGARFITDHTAEACLRIFLKEPFEGRRHLARVQQLY